MKMNISLIRRIFWPERASLFVIIGGAAGMAGDMVSFFTDIVSPAVLTTLFALGAMVCVALCLRRAVTADATSEAEVKAVVNCGVCDAMRFSLFAAAAFTILLIVGQGKSATESVAGMLGLMQKDVSQIAADVGDLSDIAQSHKVVNNPKNAADFFRNAWIYTNIQRDNAAAFKALDDMYQRFSPRKLDSAELYYNAGRQIKGRTELIARMEELAQAQQDVSLLVIAARGASSTAEADRLIAAAQAMDSQYPFAYFDMGNPAAHTGRVGGGPAAQLAAMDAQIGNMEKFLALIGEYPAAHFFFLPQYQPDYDMTVRQHVGSLKGSAESLRQSVVRLEEAQRKAGQR